MLVWVELQLCRVHVAKKGTFIVHLIRMVGMVHALNQGWAIWPKNKISDFIYFNSIYDFFRFPPLLKESNKVCWSVRLCSSRRDWHFSYSAGCLCFRCWNRFVVLLPFTAIGFRQMLQRGVCCSTSVAANPYQFQTTDDFIPFLGTNFPLSPVAILSLAVAVQCMMLSLWETNTTETPGSQKCAITQKLDLLIF